MKGVRYTFTVVRYMHDRAAGETLNVGVILIAPDVGFLDSRVEPRFERLSRTFSGFDGDVYRQTLNRLCESVRRLRPQVNELPLRPMPNDATDVIRSIWPDSELSFTAGPLLSGIATEPLEHVIDALFSRMVSS